MNRSLVFTFFGKDATAGSTMRRLGTTAQISSGRLSGLSTAVGVWARRAALAAGVAAVAAGAAVLKIGMAYQDSLNIFKAVTRATGAQMDAVAAKAKALGANLKLPQTSAADAANAMTELAKGGLNVKQSLGAALGTLRLSTAAQVDAATAAKIESAALNQFSLKGRSASHVADLLANASIAAQGEITDMATALNYVGPVAHATGISLDDTATAVSLLAKRGLSASTIGTSLRGVLTSVASPATKAAGALKALGVRAYDAAGNFVGLRKITEELAAARGRLTHQAYAAATADAFQKRNLAGVNILAEAGVKAWDKMRTAVTRNGGAARISEARTKGLHGALQGLQSQLETVAISLYTKVSPGLTRLVHGISESVPAVSAFVGEWGAKLGPALTTVGDFIVKDVVPAVSALAKSLGGDVVGAFQYLAGAIRPNLDGLKTIGSLFMTMAKVTLVVWAAQMKVSFLVLSRAIGAAIVIVGQLGKAFAAVKNFFAGPFVGAIRTVASVFVTALRIMVDTGLGIIGHFVDGAAAAFGWLPLGIGGKLKEAAAKFDEFRSSVNGKISALAGDMAGGGQAIGNALGFNIFAALSHSLANVGAALFPRSNGTMPSSHGSGPGSNPTAGQPGGGYHPTPKSGGGGGYVPTPVGGTGTYTPTPGAGGGKSPASKTASILTHFSVHQLNLLGKGLLNGFRGASGRLLGRLSNGLQDQFNSLATRIEHGLQRWADRVKTARDKMLADIKSRKSMAASIRDALTGGADLSGVFSTDQFTGKNVMNNVGSFLTNQLGQLKTFAKDLALLRKRGLSARLLAMVANLGPAQGVQVANQILSGMAGSIGSLNKTERRIEKVGQAAGDTVAHATYDSKVAEDRKTLREQLHEQRKGNRLLERLVHALGDSSKTSDEVVRDLRKLKRHLGHDLGLA